MFILESVNVCVCVCVTGHFGIIVEISQYGNGQEGSGKASCVCVCVGVRADFLFFLFPLSNCLRLISYYLYRRLSLKLPLVTNNNVLQCVECGLSNWSHISCGSISLDKIRVFLTGQTSAQHLHLHLHSS